MIMTITVILLSLVAFNFLLLFFSCNKITKKEVSKKPQVSKNKQPKPTLVSSQLPSSQLAPTGS